LKYFESEFIYFSIDFSFVPAETRAIAAFRNNVVTVKAVKATIMKYFLILVSLMIQVSILYPKNAIY